MNIKTFLIPVIYSILIIATTCICFYGGMPHKLNIISIFGWLLLLPFCLLQIVFIKKTKYNNSIGGRDATKEGLIFVMITTLILLIFQTIFFIVDLKEFKINFFETQGFELAKQQITNGMLKIKDSEIPDLIKKEVAEITLTKELTLLVFKNVFLGIFASFIGGVFFKFKSVTAQ